MSSPVSDFSQKKLTICLVPGYHMVMLTKDDIKELRLALGDTAAEFAARLGVSEDCIWRWERGNRHPTYKRMLQLNELREKEFPQRRRRQTA